MPFNLKTAFYGCILLWLAGCTDYVADHAHAWMAFSSHLIGGPVSAFTDVWGPANRNTSGPKGHMYEWTNAPQGPAVVDNYGGTLAKTYCTYHVFTKLDNTVMAVKVRGDLKACHEYDEKINDKYPYYPNGRLVNKAYNGGENFANSPNTR